MSTIEYTEFFGFLEANIDRDESMDVEVNESALGIPLDELGFDSLTIFNAMSQIGEEYGVEFGFDDVMAQRTLDDLFALIRAKLS